MNENVNKYIATVKRNFSNPTNALEYSLTIFIVSCTIFGSLMLYIAMKKIPVLNIQLNEVKAEVSKLESLKYYRMDVSSEAAKGEMYRESLNLSVPNKSETDRFLIQIMSVMSENGFSVLRISTEPSEDLFSTIYQVESLGDVKYIPDLLEKMSKMERFVIVNGLDSDGANVMFNIQTFHTKPETLDFTQENNVKLDIEFLEKEFEPVHERN